MPNVEGFYTSSKDEQVKIIIDMLCIDHGETSLFKNWFEKEHNVSFEFEKLRFDYSFLKHLTVYQAVNLYDSLVDTMKDKFISIIDLDHKHLLSLVHIHKTVTGFNNSVVPIVYS